MAERTDAFANRIGAAFVQRIEDYVADNPDLWKNPPAKVDFGLKGAWEQGPFPLIGVTIPQASDPSLDANAGRSEVTIMVLAFLKSGADSERAVHDMVADIRRAFVDASDGRQLGDVLASGLIFYDGWEAAVDDAGISMAVLNFRGLFQWDEDAA